jgi:hypothetical protein
MQRSRRARWSKLWALPLVTALLAVGLATTASAVPPPLTVSPTTATGSDQVAAALDPTWVAGCEVTFGQPLAINLQTVPQVGDGVISSVLPRPDQPSYTTSVDEWFSNTAYEAGTYWFVAFCYEPGGQQVQVTNAVALEVPSGQVPEAMKVGLDPSSGTASTPVSVSVGPLEPSFFVPCDPSRDAEVVVSTSPDVLDPAAEVSRTAIAAPFETVMTTRPLEEWLGGAPTAPRYWFWSRCPYVNDDALFGYTLAVPFDVVVPATPVAVQAVAVTPAFTG